MEQRLLKRIQELTEQLDAELKEKETVINHLRALDRSIDAKSASLFELRNILEAPKE
jgi:hypothetical protein